MRAKSDGLFHVRRRGLTAAILLVAALLFSGPGLAASDGVLTLSQALRITSAKSLQARDASYDTASAQADTAGVKSLYYPQVSLAGGHVHLDSDPAFRLGPMLLPAGEQVYWKHSLSAREILWDGGRRAAAMRAGRNAERAVVLGGREAVARAQAGVVAEYVTALAARVNESVVEKRREALTEHLKIVRDLYTEGVVARNDLLRTEVALRSVEDQSRRVKNLFNDALERLNKDMGLDSQAPTRLPDTLPPPPVMTLDEGSCVKAALTDNPGVKAAEARVEAMKERLVLSRRDYSPSVIAEAGHTYEQNRYMAHNHVNSLFLGLSWNLFDGGARAAKIQKARAEVDKALRHLVETKRTLKHVALKQYRDYMEALEETKTARLNVAAAEENFRIVEDQYGAGLLKTTDVLDAESVLAESRFKEATAYYGAYVRQAALLAVMGRDLESYYATANREEGAEARAAANPAGGR